MDTFQPEDLVLEKTLESPLDCQEIQPVHPKGDQSWAFTGRTDAEAETPILWPPHAKSWLFEKDPDAGRDWGQEEKGTTEDEMAGLGHRLDGIECESTQGVGDGQGGLTYWDSWGRQESDTAEWLNWTETRTVKIWTWTSRTVQGRKQQTKGMLARDAWVWDGDATRQSHQVSEPVWQVCVSGAGPLSMSPPPSTYFPGNFLRKAISLKRSTTDCSA